MLNTSFRIASVAGVLALRISNAAGASARISSTSGETVGRRW
jgi:hypothetical protein